MCLPRAGYKNCSCLNSQPSAGLRRQWRTPAQSQPSPGFLLQHSSRLQIAHQEQRAQLSKLWLGQGSCSRSTASQRCTAVMALMETDGARPAGEGAASDDHGSAPRNKRLAVFVSGGGSNMRAIHAATLDGRLPASIEVRPCRRAALQRVAAESPSVNLAPGPHPSPDADLIANAQLGLQRQVAFLGFRRDVHSQRPPVLPLVYHIGRNVGCRPSLPVAARWKASTHRSHGLTQRHIPLPLGGSASAALP